MSALAAIVGAGMFFSWYINRPPVAAAIVQPSAVVLDQSGVVLQAYLSEDDKWRLPVELENVDPVYLKFLIAVEDRRFFAHWGVDPIALVRAAAQLIRNGRIISGGSTITMQLARLLQPRQKQNGILKRFEKKASQFVQALRLERHYSKEKILEMYLTLAPFGGNIEGIRAATLTYFNKEPNAISLSEAALLVALPQAPEARRPDRFPQAARRARDNVLKRVEAAGLIDPGELAEFAGKPVNRFARKGIGLARHAAGFARSLRSNDRQIETTLDAEFQAFLQKEIDLALASQSRNVSAAAVVVRNHDRSIAAYVSGTDRDFKQRRGFVDLVRAIRSPGSTLKPVIYGMAFEDLIVHPDTRYRDSPIRFGTYQPENFSGSYIGNLTVREALTASLNTTAIALLYSVGPARFVARLNDVRAPLKHSGAPSAAGLAMGLGGGGATLLDLVKLYAAISEGGEVAKLRILGEEDTAMQGQVLSPDASWAIADILADSPPPAGMRPRKTADGGRRIAYKTGTSYGHRDGWAIGFDQNHTVGFWIGRPDGIPVNGILGYTTAAPVLYRIFDKLPLPQKDVAGPPLPNSLLAPRKTLPPRLQKFRAADEIMDPGDPLEILYPPTGAHLFVPRQNQHYTPIQFEIRGGKSPHFWLVNGKSIGQPTHDKTLAWQPQSRGSVSLQVLDSNGRSKTIQFWVE